MTAIEWDTEGRRLFGGRRCTFCCAIRDIAIAYEAVHLETGIRAGPICQACTPAYSHPWWIVLEGQEPDQSAFAVELIEPGGEPW